MTLVLELKRCVVSDFGAAWFRISALDGSWLLALWICDLVCFIYTCFKGNSLVVRESLRVAAVDCIVDVAADRTKLVYTTTAVLKPGL